MTRRSSGFVLGVFLQVPPAASARALSSYALVGRRVSQLVLRIQADAADAVTVPRRDAQKCGRAHTAPVLDYVIGGGQDRIPSSSQLSRYASR